MKFGLFVILSMIASCTVNNIPTPMQNGDYIIFGHFYGSCLGDDCVEIYKLTSDQLLKDTKKEYPSSESVYEGNFVPLSPDQYQVVNDLINAIPEALLKEEKHLIGAPDAADQGGIYFEYKSGDIHHFWLIDQAEENIPEYLRSFVRKIKSSIKKLKSH